MEVRFFQQRATMSTADKAFRIYLACNAIRFLTVGIIDYKANHHIVDELNGISSDCCNCYFVSQNSTTLSMNGIDNKRFDLSYCMPTCTSCNHCDTIHNDSLATFFCNNNASIIFETQIIAHNMTYI